MKRHTLSLTLLLGLIACSLVLPQTGKAQAAIEIEDAAWGLRFTPPEGWMQHATKEGYLFTSPSQEGILAILPHETRSLDALRTEARQGISDNAGTRLQLQSEIEAFGDNGLAATYGGTIEGRPAKARVIGLIAPQGAGVTILLATAPQHFAATYAEMAEAVVRSVVFSAPSGQAATAQRQAAGSEEQEWQTFLQGCRLSYFNSYDSGYGGGGYIDETVVDLCPGYFTFGDHSETTFNAADLSGGDVYSQRNRRGAGAWGVVRQNGQSVLQLQFHDGTVRTYVLGYDDSKTFLDGKRWLRTCNPNDSVVEARPQCR